MFILSTRKKKKKKELARPAKGGKNRIGEAQPQKRKKTNPRRKRSSVTSQM